jgi:uncharacterized protein YjdB
MIASEELMLRQTFRLLPVLALIVFCGSCSDFFVSPNSIQKVTISPAAVLLKASNTPADTFTSLGATSTTVGGTAATTTTATWTSANTSIVTVSSAGVLTAGSATTGNTTVTATAGGVVSNACAVVLYLGTAPATLSVESQTGATSFAAGSTFQAIATATFPGDATLSASGALTPYVTWSSSDSTGSIATVNSAGVVTVVSAGTPFTITAIATFGAAASTSTVQGTSVSFNQTIL